MTPALLDLISQNKLLGSSCFTGNQIHIIWLWLFLCNLSGIKISAIFGAAFWDYLLRNKLNKIRGLAQLIFSKLIERSYEAWTSTAEKILELR